MLQYSTTPGQRSPVQVEQVSPHFFPEQGVDGLEQVLYGSMHFS
jgi:hypothetical protein